MKTFDLQVNGAFGVDFSDPELTADSFLQAVDKILAAGCTRFLPTLPTAPWAVYQRNLPLMTEAIESHGLRYALPGFHLEGPFITTEQGYYGAHRLEAILPPDTIALDKLNALTHGHIAILTVAAEVAGMPDFIRYAHSLGIIVSIGHSHFTAQALQDAKADAITHLGNAMPNLLDRHHSPIWTGLADDDYPVMAICDGHHLPAELVKCYVRCKGVDKFIAVSDACNVAGLPPGRYYSYGNDAVLEPNGLYHNPAKGFMVGSSSLLPKCAQFLREKLAFNEDIIEKFCWINPHKLMKMSL